jgi:hypothetical protein
MEQAETLQDEHPDWHLWRAAGGSWMATRRRVLSIGELFPDLDNTLMEKTPEALAAKLDQQRLAEAAA